MAIDEPLHPSDLAMTRPGLQSSDGDVDVQESQPPRDASQGLNSDGFLLERALKDLGMGGPQSWISLADHDEDDGDEELAPLTPLAVKSSAPIIQPAQSSVGREVEASQGWQEVLLRRGPRHP